MDAPLIPNRYTTSCCQRACLPVECFRPGFFVLCFWSIRQPYQSFENAALIQDDQIFTKTDSHRYSLWIM